LKNKYIFLSKNKVEIEIDYSLLDKFPKAAIFVPKLEHQGKVFHNARNYPNFFDLLIKNIPVLRNYFPQRMRRYLNWDLNENKVTEVDWGTYDCMIIKKSFYDKYKSQIKIDESYNDLFLSLLAHKDQLKIYYIPFLKGEVNKIQSYGGLVKIFNFLLFKLKKIGHRKLDFPSNKYKVEKFRVLKTHSLKNNSIISKVGKVFQRQNKVIKIYEALIEGSFKYKQPLVFSPDSIVCLVVNSKKEIGLIKIWRHAPLKMHSKNLFPIFPDTLDLGIYSLEAIRGGVENYDKDFKSAVLRELSEEIGLKNRDILKFKKLGRCVSNTAWDVFSATMYFVEVKENFQPKLEDEEHIKSFKFYSNATIRDMIKKEKLVCALTKACILEYFLIENR